MRKFLSRQEHRRELNPERGVSGCPSQTRRNEERKNGDQGMREAGIFADSVN